MIKRYMLNRLINMKNTDILNRIMTLLNSKVELKQMTLKDGSMIECATYEVGADVFKIDGENKEPLEVGEYTLEDGSKLYVTEAGKIGEIASEETEIVEEEMAEDPAPAEEEKMAEVPATLEEILSAVVSAIQPKLDDMQAKIDALSGMESDMKDVKEKLSSQIVSKPTTHKPAKDSKDVQFKSESNSPQSLIFAKLANIQK